MTVAAAGLVAVALAAGLASTLLRVAPGGRIEAEEPAAAPAAAAPAAPAAPLDEEVTGEVTTPRGERVDVPAYYTGYGWSLRYLAREPGRYAVRVRKGGPSVTVDVEAGTIAKRGVVGVSRAHPRALAWQDGTPYVARGANACWSAGEGWFDDVARWHAGIVAAGGNWTRLWLVPWGRGFTIERTPGAVDFDVASRLDALFAQAEERGLAVQWVLFPHAMFAGSWSENAYASLATSPRAFFADPEARAHAARLVRYLVARYASYRSIFAWEIMNEEDLVEAPAGDVRAFADAIAAEIRALDPAHHLVTTSFWSPAHEHAATWNGPLYDLVQVHLYGADFRARIPAEGKALAAIPKPALLAEFGVDPRGPAEDDATVAEASRLAREAGFAGDAMPWWWETHVKMGSVTAPAPARAAAPGLAPSSLARAAPSRPPAGCGCEAPGAAAGSAATAGAWAGVGLALAVAAARRRRGRLDA